ncbi:MAG: SDR family NAD(P)-dependent oxidoreductase, partial [Rhizonema sp. PD38]|nr:SDR family NAD(P)-dependent oxidoreductase [Rhizonema sp. PD38]
NAHIVLEEPAILDPLQAEVERPVHLLTLSAKTEEALKELAVRYDNYLAAHPSLDIKDICFTANTGRSHFTHRLSIVATSSIQISEKLQNFSTGQELAGVFKGQGSSLSKVAFLFTGQGSQYVGMGRQLYETQPTFRASLDCCDKILRPYLQKPLLSVLYPESGETSPLDETAYTQPALFALEYSLVQLWKSWGIKPTAVMGHSVGEYVAACVAGVFSLEDGLKLISERARLMQKLPQDGEMVAVFADIAAILAVAEIDEQKVAIAALNGPRNTVISGETQAVRTICNTLEFAGITTKKLKTSHAFHSPLMEPILAEFYEVAATVTYAAPQINLISNLTGERLTSETDFPEYWCRHLRSCVRFAESLKTLQTSGHEIFVEIGPKPTLLGMGRHCLSDVETQNLAFLPSLRQGQPDWQQMLQSLGELYVRGILVDWSAFDQGYSRRRIVLPTYPFQRQRYWVEKTESEHLKADNLSQETLQSLMANLTKLGDTQQLVKHLEITEELSEDELKLLPKLLNLLVQQNQQQLVASSIKDWFYETQWQVKPRHVETQEKNRFHKASSWLIFADSDGVGKTLAKLLQSRGHTCILVYVGDTYEIKEAGTWNINPNNPADLERLFQEALGTLEQPLQGVVHLWSLEAQLASNLTISSLEEAQTVGVGSVLNLIKRLRKNLPCSQSPFPRLWLVTRGAVSVCSELPEIAQASLWGMGKVVALEHPELWGGMLDLAPESTFDQAAKLLAEIEDSFGEDHIAFRNGNRYVARLVPKQLPQSNVEKLDVASLFRKNGTYLITGGLGALGLSVAQWMVEKGARQLVLIGRRIASTEAQETLRQLEQKGTKVVVVQADVSQWEDVSRLLEEVKNSMPPLRGIFHAAGVLQDGMLLGQTEESFRRVMAPKVQGAWNLHALTQNLELDLFVCFSS